MANWGNNYLLCYLQYSKVNEQNIILQRHQNFYQQKVNRVFWSKVFDVLVSFLIFRNGQITEIPKQKTKTLAFFVVHLGLKTLIVRLYIDVISDMQCNNQEQFSCRYNVYRIL